MSRKKRADTRADYEIGYGRPPEEHQFPKGRSGNPTGKPKSGLDQDDEKPQPSLLAVVRDELNKPLSEFRKPPKKNVTMLQTLVRKAAIDAANGDKFSEATIMKWTIAATRQLPNGGAKNEPLIIIGGLPPDDDSPPPGFVSQATDPPNGGAENEQPAIVDESPPDDDSPQPDIVSPATDPPKSED